MERKYRSGEVAARGDAIYKKIKSSLGDLEKGTFVVIDIESGDYEVGATDGEATFRLRDRRPSAVTWAVRVGYRAVGRLPSMWPPSRDA